MKLVQLKLRNFRQHADSTIDFENGMTAIVGANGTGKSTILEAIAFALYGEQRDTRDTIRFYWSEDRGHSVSLEFEFDSRRFVVERKTQDASLREVSPKEHVWAAGLRPTTEACERLLNLNYEQFKNSFCAEQKGLAFLQFGNKRARQEEVARMLGFHRLKAAEELAFQRRQTLAGQVTTLESLIGDPKEAEVAKEDAEILHKATLQELEAASKQKDELASRLAASEEAYGKANRWIEISKEMREVAGKAEGLKASVKITKTEFEAAEADAKQLEVLEPQEKQYRETEQRLKEVQKHKEAEQQRILLISERERLGKDAEALRLRATELKAPDAEGLARLAQKVSCLEQDKLATDKVRAEQSDAWQQAQVAGQSRLSEAKAHLQQAKTTLKRSEQAYELGVCAECGQPTGENYLQVVEQRKRELFETQTLLDRATRSASVPKPDALAEAEAKLASLEPAIKEAKKELETAERLKLQEKGLLEQAAEQTRKAEAVSVNLEKLPAQYDPEEHASLQKTVEGLKQAHESYLHMQGAGDRLNQRKIAYEEAEKNLDSAKIRYRGLDSERKGLGIESDEQATAIVTEHNALVSQKLSAETLATQKQTQLIMAERALNAATTKLEEIRQKQKDLKELKTSHSLHDHTVKEMRKLRSALNANIGPDLAARASENLNLLTNGRYDTLRLDADFTAELVEEGVAKAVISGGEEDVVALSLRLALSELIQERQGRPMSLLVLDEVFGSLDADRRQAVLDRLTALKGRFQQILVISHIEEINQVADQCLYLSRSAATKATIVSDAPPGGFGELG